LIVALGGVLDRTVQVLIAIDAYFHRPASLPSSCSKLIMPGIVTDLTFERQSQTGVALEIR
ncbi:MAG: hypothetical protein Q8P12_08230, partial [bacterium]|nr:hypothetical protein [bacterium]